MYSNGDFICLLRGGGGGGACAPCFHSLHLLFTLHFHILLFLLFICKYLVFYLSSHCFRNCIYTEFLFMNLNLKMNVERLKHCSQFLSLIFITKCFKNLLLGNVIIIISKLNSTFEMISKAMTDKLYCIYIVLFTEKPTFGSVL